MAVLAVKNLSLWDSEKAQQLLENITFDLHADEVIGLFGRSGSGKSLLCKGILNLLSQNIVRTGEILYFERERAIDLTNKKNLRKVRGQTISLMPQQIFKSLNPMLSNGEHLLQLLKGKEKKEKAHQLLQKVGFINSREIMDKYPHHLSGGELSRFGFALAIVKEPKILLLDEAFTAIDQKLQNRFIRLIQKFKSGKSILLVTHNPAILQELTDRTIFLEEGKIIYNAKTANLFANPPTEYLKNLKQAYMNLYF